ncbi:nucleotidyltransferase [Chryseotalea sanaruensis]|uniref:Nucleotidyltransferase n=1 Tax=Chryseotalea sanaruensis TaxID=2482724 RepID=A0A401UED2_9BACT|nr:nucleotidyltransferase domain-containing protein [Chryseotalea sanaruensis]GCC53253.1 nucleotidyltransferase [Chryseotalea sanaruensis]
MATINYVLQKIAGNLFIKYDSKERENIETRIANFKVSIKDYFTNNVKDILLFGSFKRDTILPRKFDEDSDIDILIIFNQSQIEFTPETYRNQLRRFAEERYFTSTVIKSHPSVVLEMSSIKFDLVPCIVNSTFWSSSFQIPSKSGSWMETDPKGFNEKLTQANNSYNSIVKPIIRLLKRWNAFNDYPYESFYLEQLIADMNFGGDNYQTGFLYAIDKLSEYGLPEYQKKKVYTLKNNANWIQEYLKRDNQDKATEVVYRILGLYN